MRKTPKRAARMALEMGCLTSNAIERESPDVCLWAHAICGAQPSASEWKAIFDEEAVAVVTKCEIRGRFRGCAEQAFSICQYCGRNFCGKHGGRLADGQEICTRSICQRKQADLEQHLAYKETVAERNGGRMCGHAGCAQRPIGQCSKCQGLFCIGHLEEREIEGGRGINAVRRRGSFCPHCLKRRSLWSRM